MGLFTKRQLTGQVDKNSLPRHVAVIMDGNGRWYDNKYDCQHEQRGKAHQHGYISPYLRNAEL